MRAFDPHSCCINVVSRLSRSHRLLQYSVGYLKGLEPSEGGTKLSYDEHSPCLAPSGTSARESACVERVQSVCQFTRAYGAYEL